MQMWRRTARLSLLSELYPQARVIACVRGVGWILDSIERQGRRNPLRPSKLFNYKPGGSVYSRIDTLIDPDEGLVGLAWSSLREAWFSEAADRLIIVNYDDLAREPRRILTRLYQALGQPWFDHDFHNVVHDEPAYDEGLGLPELHRVRRMVAPEQRSAAIPADLFAKYADTAFWTSPRLNVRNVTIL